MTRTRMLAAALLVLATGCASGRTETADPGPAEAVPHGYVEGAVETAEPQQRLVVADGETGAVRVLDLTTAQTFTLGRVGGVDGIAGDGRFAYLTSGRGKALNIVDGGTWTVDHGDHLHHYRAEARDVGTLARRSPQAVRSDPAVAAVSFSDGSVELLDRTGLGKGEITRIGVTEGDGTALPYREHLILPVAGDAVDVRTADGEPVTSFDEPCAEPRGAAVTRAGAVLGCADGALLVVEDDGAFTAEKIAYPGEVPRERRARHFEHRPGGTTLAAKAGGRGVWLLDVRAKKWTLLKTGPPVAVCATGPDTPVLILTADGFLRAYDPESGRQTAKTALIGEPAPGTQVIEADASRAYVNDPAARVIHEIDYNDGLRLARTLDPGITPTHMVETGR
ncbi:ABC transporter [Rhizohabitans arisaemae]|uniref:ABC transporter n=1 Tax=Rhizohabitans arisaemae TaxID=2720610 RepID=UPI0024B0EA46|nr:ABC transporter [Rhizohabitans arisaemae]